MSILLTKITTKTGDKGKTLGPGCKMLSKNDIKIEFFGTLDELNCAIGFAHYYLNDENVMQSILEKLQHEIFEIGAMFFNKKVHEISEMIKNLEEKIAQYNDALPALNSFILPQGNLSVLNLHKARCKTRNAERIFWQCKLKEINEIGIYLNRLSDLLFIFIRKLSQKNGEKLWQFKNSTVI